MIKRFLTYLMTMMMVFTALFAMVGCVSNDMITVTFDGNGGQLFGNYIKWFLLSIITLGIYSFWLTIKMQQWVTKHTHISSVSAD